MKKSVRHEPLPSLHPAASPSFEELAQQQGVAPVENLEALLGKPSAEDESAEEFAVMLRGWRSEGSHLRDPR
jgi:hypothetical protein